MVMISILGPIAYIILLICGIIVIGLLLILAAVISGAVMWGMIRRTILCWGVYLKQVFALAKSLANDPELKEYSPAKEAPSQPKTEILVKEAA